MSKILIYGSCVSRDSFEFLGQGHELGGYIARQSVISGMSKATKLLPGSRLKSAFQNRMLDGDINSNLTSTIEGVADEIDLLLIDLTDERLGVHKLPAGSFVTHSTELVRSARLQQLSPVPGVIQLGSERHNTFWRSAARKFYSKLDSLGLQQKTIVINTPWATTSFEGAQVPDFRNIPTAQMNQHLNNCADTVRSLGFKVVDMPEALAVSTASHQWGIAPFHYGKPAYLWIRDQVNIALEASTLWIRHRLIIFMNP